MTGTPRRLRMPLFTAVTALLAGFLSLVGAAAPAQADATAYPVPTSAAGLGRIVPHPDGSLWFVEEDVNKVGRITTGGQITEVALPAMTSPGVDGGVQDLDIAADGTVWVVYDHGRHALALNPDGSTKVGPVSLGPRPYGKEIRVAPDGTPWITMSYDEHFIALIDGGVAYRHPNSPKCDGALGIGHDGTKWCQDFDKVTQVNSGGDGGTSHPLPSKAAYPNSLSPGPVGSVWYARHGTATWVTRPSSGSIGYIDAASGAVTDFDTGSKTAPASLVQQGGRMWFTNVGTEPAIGHYDVATGEGAITRIGNYSPTWLTVGADGAIWATDAKNNVILRVPIADLMTTDIDLGTGSVIKPHVAPVPPTNPTNPPPPTTPGTSQVGKVKAGKKPIKVRKKTVKLTISCPASASAGCRGAARIRVNKSVITTQRPYSVKPGKKATVKLKVTQKGTRKIKKRKPTKAVAELLAPGARKPSARKKIRLRR